MKILIFDQRFFYLLFFCIFSISGWTGYNTPLLADPGQTSAPDRIENYPLNITSDKMIARKNESMVEFKGKVKATQKDSVLTADSIKVYFDSDTDPLKSRGSIQKIVASGSVVYTEGNRKAYADNAVYTASDQKLVLTGKSTRLVTGKSFVAGRKITLFRNDDRMVIESSGEKRVTARFNPEDAPEE